MLAKKYRLPIQEVFQKRGASIKTPYFLLKIFENNLPFNRFGVIISKKTEQKSTGRNRLKRLVLDSLEKFLFLGDEKRDILIITSPAIKGLKKEKIIEELNKNVPNLIF